MCPAWNWCDLLCSVILRIIFMFHARNLCALCSGILDVPCMKLMWFVLWYTSYNFHVPCTKEMCFVLCYTYYNFMFHARNWCALCSDILPTFLDSKPYLQMISLRRSVHPLHKNLLIFYRTFRPPPTAWSCIFACFFLYSGNFLTCKRFPIKRMVIEESTVHLKINQTGHVYVCIHMSRDCN